MLRCGQLLQLSTCQHPVPRHPVINLPTPGPTAPVPRHRLEEAKKYQPSSTGYVKKNSRYISSTDPDATIVNRGKPKLSYQVHRSVDETAEVITATDVAPGDISEAIFMFPLLDKHEATTGVKADTVVADSKYGTIDNGRCQGRCRISYAALA